MKTVIVLVVILLLSAPAAFAGTSTLTLRRVSLTNVPDAAGSW